MLRDLAPIRQDFAKLDDTFKAGEISPADYETKLCNKLVDVSNVVS